jgi:3-carboxy-cis,cis-muconate cycloisomerase
VAEAAEAPAAGRGGSSTMPQKRNPVGAAVALAAAARAPGLVATLLAAMPQEHERGLGGWHAEWDTLPELVRVTAGGARAVAQALEGLAPDAARMAANLALTGGAITAEAVALALAPALGRDAAHRRVAAACAQAAAGSQPLAAILAADPEVTAHLPPAALERLLDPAGWLGSARELVARALRAAGEPPGRADA